MNSSSKYSSYTDDCLPLVAAVESELLISSSTAHERGERGAIKQAHDRGRGRKKEVVNDHARV